MRKTISFQYESRVYQAKVYDTNEEKQKEIAIRVSDVYAKCKCEKDWEIEAQDVVKEHNPNYVLLGLIETVHMERRTCSLDRKLMLKVHLDEVN